VSHYIVGLTGGIGSGKSTVAEAFVALGASLVDTDAIAHELTGPQGAAMPALRAAFGPSISAANGALDRAAMRQLVFSNPAEKSRLETILHPLIRQIAAERCQTAGTPYVILAVPLLFESGNYRTRCTRIAVVDCPESVQIARVMQRNALSAEEVRRIMQTQASRTDRLGIADDVIENGGDRQALRQQVEKLHFQYLRQAAEIPQAKC
jgi:dephospho-CoA kinase